MSEPISPELWAELRESLLGAIQNFFDKQLAPKAEADAGATRQRVTDRQLSSLPPSFFSRSRVVISTCAPTSSTPSLPACGIFSV